MKKIITWLKEPKHTIIKVCIVIILGFLVGYSLGN